MKEETTAYGSILNDIKKLKNLVMRMYTVALFDGDKESSQKGFEVADDFGQKVIDLEERFIRKAASSQYQIIYGDFDDIIEENVRLREEALEYLNKDDKEKNTTRERYISKIENIDKTLEKKSTEELWRDLRTIVEDWKNEFKDYPRFEVLEHEINKSISKTSLMILENQAKNGEKINLNPVDELCGRDYLLSAIKEKFIEMAKYNKELETKQKLFETAQNLTEKRLTDPKVWELLVEKDSVKVEKDSENEKVEKEQTTVITEQNKKSKPKGLFERFRGKTIYTFGDIDPDTGDWINIEELHAKYPQILSKKQADRLLKIEINGVEKVKETHFRRNCMEVKFENLKEVIIGDDVKEIEPYTFWGYSSLKNVKIGEGITCLPESCFEHSGLKKVEIPGNVETIGKRAFYDCKDLKKVIVKKGVKRIQEAVFLVGYNRYDYKISIPETVEILNNRFICFKNGREDAREFELEISEGIKIKLFDYLDLFKEGKLDREKLNSLKKHMQTEIADVDKKDNLDRRKQGTPTAKKSMIGDCMQDRRALLSEELWITNLIKYNGKNRNEGQNIGEGEYYGE